VPNLDAFNQSQKEIARMLADAHIDRWTLIMKYFAGEWAVEG
jgi:hypothetical protein